MRTKGILCKLSQTSAMDLGVPVLSVFEIKGQGMQGILAAGARL